MPPISILDQLRRAEQELDVWKDFYAHHVAQGHFSQAAADKEIADMTVHVEALYHLALQSRLARPLLPSKEELPYAH